MGRRSNYLSGAIITVAGLGCFAGAGLASASPAAADTVSTTPCPVPYSGPLYGDGTTASADAAYSALSAPVTPTVAAAGQQLAFTGSDTTKLVGAGVVLVGAGGLIVFRTRRRVDGVVVSGPDGSDLV